jgi:hypothetical protein
MSDLRSSNCHPNSNKQNHVNACPSLRRNETIRNPVFSGLLFALFLAVYNDVVCKQQINRLLEVSSEQT